MKENSWKIYLRTVWALLIISIMIVCLAGRNASAQTQSITLVPDSATVTTTIGQTITVGVSAFPQGSPPTGAECKITSGPTWNWSTDTGTIDQNQGSSTNVHASFAAMGTYTVVIHCSLNYTSTCGDYSATGSTSITVTVGPHAAYAISIAGPGGSNVVAASAGALSSGTITITISNPDGTPAVGKSAPGLIITNGHGVNVDASASCSGSSDARGIVTGTYSASDVVGTVTVAVSDGTGHGASASVNQHWNDNGSPWQFPATFNYDVPATISYTMKLQAGGSTPLTGHQLSYVTTSEHGLEWDPNAGPIVNGAHTGDYVDATHANTDANSGYYLGLVSYSGVTADASGSYTTQQTIHWSDQFIIDSVSFDVVDGGTYSGL